MERQLPPRNNTVGLSRTNQNSNRLIAANRSLHNHPFSDHATVFLGNGFRNTRNQETQTPPLIPPRSPTSRQVPQRVTNITPHNGTPSSRQPRRFPTQILTHDSPSHNAPHRANLPQSPITSPTTENQQISLEHGRQCARTQNEYVGSPLGRVEALRQNESSHDHNNSVHLPDERLHNFKTVALPPETAKNLLNTNVVTTLPTPIKPLKDNGKASKDFHTDSILCHRCGKCKCAQCTQKKSLPSKWIFKKRVELSADTAVECCTCLLCVRSVFYHCGRDCVSDTDDNNTCSDNPCACFSQPHTFKRWLCMTLISLCLPCLCLYWPARGCVSMCTACYNKTNRKGCRCKNNDRQCGQALLEPDSSST